MYEFSALVAFIYNWVYEKAKANLALMATFFVLLFIGFIILFIFFMNISAFLAIVYTIIFSSLLAAAYFAIMRAVSEKLDARNQIKLNHEKAIKTAKMIEKGSKS
ncbi:MULTISPECIES: hypothetical protein [Rhodobacterales]|uniref:Uncharacterized protein n=1 Tax=Parasulfitobacter algicola TaxID=2614809 RepID=A0ABX2IVH6_9RHOB|nr:MULTISPECIES: hypothetical protein [Rhodobacterales]NSX55030.1 hypothetical protein [Sulfitobacter algicola]